MRKGCEHCKDSCMEILPKQGSIRGFRIHENVLYYFDGYHGWAGIMIKFCPWCGRSLPGDEEDGRSETIQ